MQKVFANPSQLEKLAKAKYSVPQFLMMENAARGLAEFILDFAPEQVTIFCGKGNNGGDGYAAARFLQGKCKVSLIAPEPPAAEEAKAQYEMCRRLGLKSSATLGKLQKGTVLLDCLYGTGFHGQLSPAIKKLLDAANKSNAIKIACDIPSGLYFKADYTITMGCQKLALYSDKAKAVCGKIIVQDLGLSREKFEIAAEDAALIENSDLKLPLRNNRAAHKGSYGHTAVFIGDKPGAAILAATAAMNFGSGLTSLIEGDKSAARFKISPSLMLSQGIPKKATCIAAGSGFTGFSGAVAQQITEWFGSQKSPAAVFDAGFLTAPAFPALLKNLNKIKSARIILTPHLAEFSTFVKNLTGQDYPLSLLAEDSQIKLDLGKLLNKRFPHTAVIIKSANTFIMEGGRCFIVADGAQSLAKGGSGDLLAGLAASLLAQGYSSKDAAITATGYHAQLSHTLGEKAYYLTPERLLQLIK